MPQFWGGWFSRFRLVQTLDPGPSVSHLADDKWRMRHHTQPGDIDWLWLCKDSMGAEDISSIQGANNAAWGLEERLELSQEHRHEVLILQASLNLSIRKHFNNRSGLHVHTSVSKRMRKANVRRRFEPLMSNQHRVFYVTLDTSVESWFLNS